MPLLGMVAPALRAARGPGSAMTSGPCCLLAGRSRR